MSFFQGEESEADSTGSRGQWMELPLGVGAEASSGARRAGRGSGRSGRRSRKVHGAGTCSWRGIRCHARRNRPVGSVAEAASRHRVLRFSELDWEWMLIWTPAACDRRAGGEERRSFCRDPFRMGSPYSRVAGEIPSFSDRSVCDGRLTCCSSDYSFPIPAR